MFVLLLLPRPLSTIAPTASWTSPLTTATIRPSALHNYFALLQSSRSAMCDALCICSLHFNAFAPFPAGFSLVGLGSLQRVLISVCFRTKDCSDLKIYAIISLCWHSVRNLSELERPQIRSQTLFAFALIFYGSTKNTVFSPLHNRVCEAHRMRSLAISKCKAHK